MKVTKISPIEPLQMGSKDRPKKDWTLMQSCHSDISDNS